MWWCWRCHLNHLYRVKAVIPKTSFWEKATIRIFYFSRKQWSREVTLIKLVPNCRTSPLLCEVLWWQIILKEFKRFLQLDIREDDTETVSVRLLEMLASVKYRPPQGVEPSRFRAQLLAGDSRTIHHVMHWLLLNKNQVQNTAYLAKWVLVYKSNYSTYAPLSWYLIGLW